MKVITNKKGFSSIIGLLIAIGIIVAGLGTFLLTRQTSPQPFDVNVPPRTTNESQFKKPIDEDNIFCSKNVCTIAMAIKKENYNNLSQEISTWIEDVERETSQRVELKVYENNVTKEKIKSDLKDLYFSKNLRGVILVGNIPYVRAGYHCQSYPSQLQPCLDYSGTGGNLEEAFKTENLDLSDYFYIDVKNECEYNNKLNALYRDDRCFADSVNQPFWISRLTPPLHEPTEANKLLKDYFIKDHVFRTGDTTFPQKYLVYAPILTEEAPAYRKNTIAGFLDKFKQAVSPYEPGDIKFIPPEGETSNNFFDALNQGYEYVFYNGHGTPLAISPDITLQTNISKNQKALLYEFVSCSVGRYSEENYLAGRFLFNSAALVALAAQTPIFGITQPNYDFQMFLSSGKTIGEVSRLINIGAAKILGDGTLKLRYKKELPVKKSEIMLEKLELDLGKLSLKEVEKKVTFKVKNTGDSPLIINVITTYPPSKLYPVNGASVASFDFNKDVSIQPDEIKELSLNVALGGYSSPQTRPYTGKYLGFFYVYTNDPTNYIIRIPFKGEITE